jgi:hypothetical protein
MNVIEKERGETLTFILTAKDEEGDVIDLGEGAVEELAFFDVDLGGSAASGRYERLELTRNGAPAYRHIDSDIVLNEDGYFVGTGYVISVENPFLTEDWNWALAEYDDSDFVAVLKSSSIFSAPATAPDPPLATWSGSPAISFSNVVYENNYQWGVDAWIKSATTGRVHESMQPEINDQGQVVLSYDTVNLAAGNYRFDIRFTQNGVDQFTREIPVRINSTITPPSPR